MPSAPSEATDAKVRNLAAAMWKVAKECQMLGIGNVWCRLINYKNVCICRIPYISTHQHAHRIANAF